MRFQLKILGKPSYKNEAAFLIGTPFSASGSANRKGALNGSAPERILMLFSLGVPGGNASIGPEVSCDCPGAAAVNAPTGLTDLPLYGLKSKRGSTSLANGTSVGLTSDSLPNKTSETTHQTERSAASSWRRFWQQVPSWHEFCATRCDSCSLCCDSSILVVQPPNKQNKQTNLHKRRSCTVGNRG